MRLDRLVAVKVVRAELLSDREARRRFRREAQIVARLQHPSIVAIFDYGTLPDGGAFLVMELVRGEDLRRVLLREGRLDAAARRPNPDERLQCNRGRAPRRRAASRPQAGEHPAAGRRRAGQGARLRCGEADYRRAASERRRRPATWTPATVLTAAGMIVGTPAYMAPEQFRGTDARRADRRLQSRGDRLRNAARASSRSVAAASPTSCWRSPAACPRFMLATAATCRRRSNGRSIRARRRCRPSPATPQAFAHLINADSGLERVLGSRFRFNGSATGTVVEP